jgi:hypothetical protein
MESWLQLAERHPKVTVYVVALVSLLILYWPMLRLCRALRKVKWLNKEIPWPGSRGVERGIHDPGKTILITQAPGNPSSSGGGGSGANDPVAKHLKKQLFIILLFLLLAPGCLFTYWLFSPPGFAAEFSVAFQVVCGVGLVASIVLAALLFLWLEDRLGLK